MSFKLIFDFEEGRIRSELRQQIYETFRQDFGYVISIPMSARAEFDLWAAFAEEMVPHVLGMKNIVEHFQFESVGKKLYLSWKK